MQAIILVNDENIVFEKTLIDKNLIKINGKTLIERMLNQLDKFNFERICILQKYDNDLKKYINGLDIKTKIHFIYSNDANEKNESIFNNLFPIDMEDYGSLIIKSNIILDENIIVDLMHNQSDCIFAIDQYRYWMTGKFIKLEGNKVLGYENFNSITHNNIKNSYKAIGICKISKNYIKKLNIKKCEYNELIESILLLNDNLFDIDCYKVDNKQWHEINNQEDIDSATIFFSDDETAVTESMLGTWGGYWRYPDYLDYFYLVTPYFPPRELIEEIKANFDKLLLHYPSGMRVNSSLAANIFSVESDNIVVGNGAAELIKSIMSTIIGKTGFIKPTFDEYPNRLNKEDKEIYWINNDNFEYNSDDIISFFNNKKLKNLIMVNPENPSGNYISKESMFKILDWAKINKIKLIVDESFIDFVDEDNPSLINQNILDSFPNLYVIKSISKSYGVPGLRLGVLATGDKNMIAWMKKDVSIWNINSFAEFYLQIASKYKNNYIKSLIIFREERRKFQSELSKIKEIRVIPSQANYIMIELLNNIDAECLKKRMLIDEKIFIKTLGKKINNNKQYLRLAIRNDEDNQEFIKALKRVIKNIS